LEIYFAALVRYPLTLSVLYGAEEYDFDIAAIRLKSFLIGLSSVFWKRKKIIKKEAVYKLSKSKEEL